MGWSNSAMQRVTNKDLERIAATVSENLPAGLTVHTQGRNGYTGLDLYNGSTLTDTLTTGTRREIYTYLQGMRRTQLLAR